jgi:hypothetical protein
VGTRDRVPTTSNNWFGSADKKEDVHSRSQTSLKGRSQTSLNGRTLSTNFLKAFPRHQNGRCLERAPRSPLRRFGIYICYQQASICPPIRQTLLPATLLLKLQPSRNEILRVILHLLYYSTFTSTTSKPNTTNRTSGIGKRSALLGTWYFSRHVQCSPIATSLVVLSNVQDVDEFIKAQYDSKWTAQTTRRFGEG